MHVSTMVFAAANLRPEEVKGKIVLDVGSCNYNGNLHDLYQHYAPAKFVGSDLLQGPGVDVVCPAEDLVAQFGEEQFDIVLSSELLEHTRNWRAVISNLKRLVKKGGILLLTTRSKGCGLHSFPYDYWRYELADMRTIFSDMEIFVLESDPQIPGVFIKVRKPEDFSENTLDEVALYSIIEDKRVIMIDEKVEKSFQEKTARRDRWLRLFKSVEQSLFHFGHKVLFR